MRSSRPIFDMADLNPLGNPLSGSFDEDIDEITGLPRSIMDSLMEAHGGKRRRYVWDEKPEPMPEQQQFPDPEAGPQVPMQPPEQQQPQQQSGWKNKFSLRGIAGALGDGLVGAATPNIAQGGGQDILRAGAGGWGAQQSRAEHQRQRELAAEQRKIALEDRRMKIEHETARVKREEAKAKLDEAAAQRAAAAAARAEAREDRLTKAAEQKDKYSHLEVREKGVYNKETQKFEPFTEGGTVGALGKDYNDLLSIYKKTGNEAYNPDSPENQKLMKDKHLSAKKDMNRTAADILLDPNASPEEKALAEKYEAAEFEKKKTLAHINKQQQAGVFDPSDFAIVTSAYSGAESRLQSGLAEARRLHQHAMDAADRGDEEAAPAKREAANKALTDEERRLRSVYARDTAAITARSRQIGTDIPKGGYVPPAGEAAPAAPSAVPDAVNNATGEVKRWMNGKWVTIKPPR